MPTYEYKCEACGHAFEKFQSIMAKPIRKCPKCGKTKVKKLISKGAGLIFKGSGFYITDYRSEGYKDQAKADSGPGENKSESKEAGKSDAKPEAKPSTDAAPAKTEVKTESKPAAPAASPTASQTASRGESKPGKSSKPDKK